MQTNVHKPIKKPTVSQPPPQIHTGLQALMMHLPYQSLVTQYNSNCEFVVVVVRSLAEYSVLGKLHAVSLDNPERTFVDILVVA
jgi:hypothetical protein